MRARKADTAARASKAGTAMRARKADTFVRARKGASLLAGCAVCIDCPRLVTATEPDHERVALVWCAPRFRAPSGCASRALALRVHTVCGETSWHDICASPTRCVIPDAAFQSQPSVHRCSQTNTCRFSRTLPKRSPARRTRRGPHRWISRLSGICAGRMMPPLHCVMRPGLCIAMKVRCVSRRRFILRVPRLATR